MFWLLMSFIPLLAGYSQLLLTARGTGDTAAVKKRSSKHGKCRGVSAGSLTLLEVDFELGWLPGKQLSAQWKGIYLVWWIGDGFQKNQETTKNLPLLHNLAFYVYHERNRR